MTILPLGLMGLSKSGYPTTMVKMAIAMIGTTKNNGNWDNDNQNYDCHPWNMIGIGTWSTIRNNQTLRYFLFKKQNLIFHVYIFSPCGSHRISRPPLCHRVMEIDIYKSRDCIWIMQQSNQTKMWGNLKGHQVHVFFFPQDWLHVAWWII